MIGRVLKDKYRIYDRVGTGGFATVYMGRNLESNEVVAVKVLRQEYTDEPRFVERFRREASMISQLRHPNIVRMRDYGVENGTHYLILDYVEGKTLAQLLQERGSLPVEETVAIAKQVCRAMQAAEEAGVIHRDIKPYNIMVTPAGQVKVMDFGIGRMSTLATMTHGSMFIGTPGYLSPEMAKGEGADVRSDIYALGIVMYEMLIGEAPFVADSAWAVIRHQIETPPPSLRSKRSDVPAWLEAVVNRALAKDPQQRFQTPKEMLDALSRAEMPTPNLGGILITPQPQAAPRRRVLWPLAVGAFVGLLIVGVVFLLSARKEPPPSPTPTELALVAAATASPTALPSPTPVPSSTLARLPATGTLTPTLRPPTSTPSSTTVVDTPTARPTSRPTSTPTRAPTDTARPSTPTGAPAATRTPTASPLPPLPPASAATGRIAFAVKEAGGGAYVLYSVSPDGTDLRWLGDNLRQPNYRQDGVSIVANGQGGGMNDMWHVAPNGSGPTGSFGQPEDEHPVWLQSQRGYHVAFGSTRHGDGQWRLYLGDAPIFFGSGEIRGRYPVRLPGGNIAYQGCDYGWGTDSICGTWRVTIGQKPQPITDNPHDIPNDGTGAEMLFLRQENNNRDVYRIGLSGGAATRMTDSPGRDGPAAFSHDGKAIAFLPRHGRTGRLRVAEWARHHDAHHTGRVGERWPARRAPLSDPANRLRRGLCLGTGLSLLRRVGSTPIGRAAGATGRRQPHIALHRARRMGLLRDHTAEPETERCPGQRPQPPRAAHTLPQGVLRG